MTTTSSSKVRIAETNLLQGKKRFLMADKENFTTEYKKKKRFAAVFQQLGSEIPFLLDHVSGVV